MTADQRFIRIHLRLNELLSFWGRIPPRPRFMRAIFSFYSDALKIALQSIFAHKLRAFLTLIGIIIGVASVVTVGASISGLNTYVVEKISKVLGSNHFMIARMAFSGHMDDEEFERRNRRNKRLNWDD